MKGFLGRLGVYWVPPVYGKVQSWGMAFIHVSGNCIEACSGALLTLGHSIGCLFGGTATHSKPLQADAMRALRGANMKRWTLQSHVEIFKEKSAVYTPKDYHPRTGTRKPFTLIVVNADLHEAIESMEGVEEFVPLVTQLGLRVQGSVSGFRYNIGVSQDFLPESSIRTFMIQLQPHACIDLRYMHICARTHLTLLQMHETKLQ